jgi:hypothetical protein
MRGAVVDVQAAPGAPAMQQRQREGDADPGGEADHVATVVGIGLAGGHGDAHRDVGEGGIVGVEQPRAELAVGNPAHRDTDRVAVLRLPDHGVGPRDPGVVEPGLHHHVLRRQRLRVGRPAGELHVDLHDPSLRIAVVGQRGAGRVGHFVPGRLAQHFLHQGTTAAAVQAAAELCAERFERGGRCGGDGGLDARAADAGAEADQVVLVLRLAEGNRFHACPLRPVRGRKSRQGDGPAGRSSPFGARSIETSDAPRGVRASCRAPCARRASREHHGYQANATFSSVAVGAMQQNANV